MTKLLIALALLVLVVVALVAIARIRVALRTDPAANVAGASAGAIKLGADGTIDGIALVLEEIRKKHKVAGLGVVVIRGGRVAATSVTGVRRAGGEAAITIDDRFHLGSDTKAMTATLIATLVADGTLSWTSTVGEVFDGVVEKIDEGWKGVTIEQLLHNRGGAPADLNADGLWGRLWKREGTPTEQRMQLVRGVVSRPPAAAAGTKFIYSNAGFAIAGAMAERKTGKAWEELMQERVFRPLGITSAGFGAPGQDDREGQPWGHRANGEAVEPGPEADNPPAIGPAATVHMTLADWAKFVVAHLRGHASNPARDAALIPAEMYATLHTPIDDYAMGWIVANRSWAKGDRATDKGIVLTHAGSNTMWFCVAWVAPERDFAVLAAVNQGGPAAERAADEAVGAVMERGK